jgi:branched-chain amino acid transport system permease protein
VAGATAGAVFVTALPLLMTRYADQLPLVAAPGTSDGTVGPTEAARYLYGAAIVLILLFAPDGLHGLARRLRARLRRPRAAPPPAGAPEPSPSPASAVRAKEPTP